ncbi:DUF5989 family protein [Chlamydiota bacterium]
MRIFKTIKEFCIFFWKRKLFWMAPVIIILLLLGILLILSSGSALAPFIYTLF